MDNNAVRAKVLHVVSLFVYDVDWQSVYMWLNGLDAQ